MVGHAQMSAGPKVSVVISVYGPGRALDRVVASLDAQTMPPNDFEVVFVDDGSPDDTYDELRRIAANRPNVHALQIEHSGWPSRPRNVGIESARGEYILFMDHDDSLYPDALRRAYEYASQNHADVMAIKESKTSDVWWGMETLDDGNLGNAVAKGGIDRLQPMMPHKFYRRSLLLDHAIRFPEGERVLWEDVFINVGAYRHAKVVSVLADTPVYLWHASETNSSHTFDPARLDFWDRIEDVLAFIVSTLDGSEWQAARDAVLAWEVGNRVIHRCVLLVSDPQTNDLPTRVRGLQRARRLLAQYASDAVYARLGNRQRMMLHLILAGDMRRIKALRATELRLTATTRAEAPRWRDGALDVRTTTRWAPSDPSLPAFRRDGDRVLRTLGQDLESALPSELLDITGEATSMTAQVALRSRDRYVTWKLPHRPDPPMFESDDAGTLSLVQRGAVRVDLDTAAFDRPLDGGVWDLRVKSDWLGLQRRGRLQYAAAPVPALRGHGPVVAYANNAGGLSIDLAQRLRTFVIDASPRKGPAGEIRTFSVPLDNVAVFGDVEMEVDDLVAVDESKLPSGLSGAERAAAAERVAVGGELACRVVTSNGDARLVGRAALAPGDYVLYARREGRLRRTKRTLCVQSDCRVVFG